MLFCRLDATEQRLALYQQPVLWKGRPCEIGSSNISHNSHSNRHTENCSIITSTNGAPPVKASSQRKITFANYCRCWCLYGIRHSPPLVVTSEVRYLSVPPGWPVHAWDCRGVWSRGMPGWSNWYQTCLPLLPRFSKRVSCRIFVISYIVFVWN